MLPWETKSMNEPYIQFSDEVKRYYYSDKVATDRLNKRMIRHAINSVYGLTTDYNNKESINHLYEETAQKIKDKLVRGKLWSDWSDYEQIHQLRKAIKEENEMKDVWVFNDPAWVCDPIVVPNSKEFAKDIIVALIKHMFNNEDVVSVSADPRDIWIVTNMAKYEFSGVTYSDALGASKSIATIKRTRRYSNGSDNFNFVMKQDMSVKDQTNKFFIDNSFDFDRQRMNDIFRNSNRNKMWQYRPRPKFVQFNGDYTTVVWKDGSHTVVKLSEGDEYDEEKAILFAIVKHMCGDVGCNMTRYFDEFFDHQKDVQSTEYEDWKKKRDGSE